MSEPSNPVRQMLAAYSAAVLARDAEALLALYAADVEIFDAWSAATLRGLPAWRGAVEEWFGSLGDERVRVDAHDIAATAGDNLATGHAVLTFTAMSPTGETLRWLRHRVTLALRRDESGWKVIHEHTSAPTDHATGQALLQFAT